MKLEKPLNKMTQEERKQFLKSPEGRIMMDEIKQIIKNYKDQNKGDA